MRGGTRSWPTSGTTRGDAAGPDRQQLSRRHARLRRPAPRGGRGGRHPAAPVHQSVSDRLHATGHRGHGRGRRRCASTCTCRRRAARTRCSGGCCGATPASGTSRWWRSCARRFPGLTICTDLIVGFPGRNRGAVRRDAVTRGRGRFRRGLHLQVLGARGHAGGAAGRPRRRRRSASERLERLIGVVRAQARRHNLARVGSMHEVLVERPARRGDLMLGAHPQQPARCCSTCPPGCDRRVSHGAAHRDHRSTFTGTVRRPQLAVL